MTNHRVCRIVARFSRVTLSFGVLLGGGQAFAQDVENGPVDAPTTAAAAATATDQRIDALQQKLDEIQKELIALKQARAGAQTAVQQPHAAAPAGSQFVASSSASASSSLASASAAGPVMTAAVEPVRPPVQETAKTPVDDKHSEPFSFADFTWLTGNPRTKDTPYATEFFTPEIRVDANYTYGFRHPKDDTISGSSEVFRSNEVQLTQLGVGGDFHYQNVRARLMTQFGMYSQTTPRNDASPARGQWNLDNAYRYVSEAYGGYHFNVQHGINVDAGIFMSYDG